MPDDRPASSGEPGAWLEDADGLEAALAAAADPGASSSLGSWDGAASDDLITLSSGGSADEDAGEEENPYTPDDATRWEPPLLAM